MSDRSALSFAAHFAAEDLRRPPKGNAVVMMTRRACVVEREPGRSRRAVEMPLFLRFDSSGARRRVTGNKVESGTSNGLHVGPCVARRAAVERTCDFTGN